MAKAVRLDKFLADAGKGTRSEVKKFIQKGQVQVNGVPAKKPELKVNPDKDVVVLAGETVGAAPEFVYYLLNKPAGCVSATEDRNDRTVMEYVPSDRKGLFPVGRLDKDTEGLLLITDDGMLAHELLAPGKHVDKTYFVRVEGNVTPEAVAKLEEGVDIGEAKLTMPAKAEIVGGSFEADRRILFRTDSTCPQRKSPGSLHRTPSDDPRGQIPPGQTDDGSSRNPGHLPQKDLHGNAHPPG